METPAPGPVDPATIDRGLNGTMWADRGRKDPDDPWISYRAPTVLTAFGLQVA